MKKVDTNSKKVAILASGFIPGTATAACRRVMSYSGLSRALGIEVSMVRRVCLAFERSNHPYRTVNDLRIYV